MKHKEEKRALVAQVCKCSSVNFKSLETFELSTRNGILDYYKYFDEFNKKIFDNFVSCMETRVRDFFEDTVYELYTKIPNINIDSIEYADIRVSNNYALRDDCIDFNVYFKNISKEYLLNIISQYKNKFDAYLVTNYGQNQYHLFIGRTNDLNVSMEIATNYTSFVNSFINNINNDEDDFYFTVCLDFLLSLNSINFPLMKYNLEYGIKQDCNIIKDTQL